MTNYYLVAIFADMKATSTQLFSEKHRWKYKSGNSKCVTIYRRPGTPIYGKIKHRTLEQKRKMFAAFDPARKDWKGTDDWWKRDKEKVYR